MMSDMSFSGILNFSVDEVDYSGEICAKGTGYYYPGRMYMPNGDPGYPDEEEFELKSFEVLTLFNEETEEDLLEKYNSDKEFKAKIDSAVEDSLYIAEENSEWEYENDESC